MYEMEVLGYAVNNRFDSRLILLKERSVYFKRGHEISQCLLLLRFTRLDLTF